MKPKFGHFVALYFDANKTLEIFDSLNYVTYIGCFGYIADIQNTKINVLVF